jgi:hypothetical protein
VSVFHDVHELSTPATVVKNSGTGDLLPSCVQETCCVCCHNYSQSEREKEEDEEDDEDQNRVGNGEEQEKEGKGQIISITSFSSLEFRPAMVFENQLFV